MSRRPIPFIEHCKICVELELNAIIKGYYSNAIQSCSDEVKITHMANIYIKCAVYYLFFYFLVKKNSDLAFCQQNSVVYIFS